MISAEILKIQQLMRLDRDDPTIIDRLNELAVRAKGHLYMNDETYHFARALAAEAMIRAGRITEGEGFLDDLATLTEPSFPGRVPDSWHHHDGATLGFETD